MPYPAFSTVYWPFWDSDATFLAGDSLPLESQGRLYAVLVFLFYGDKIALADIAGRGMCIPSGRIEPGETIDQTAVRECYEETGASLLSDRRSLIGCYRMISRHGKAAGEPRWCPVFVAEAQGFGPIPEGFESNGLFLAAIEDVADLYFFWDDLMAEVFSYADMERSRLFPAGTPLAMLTEI